MEKSLAEPLRKRKAQAPPTRSVPFAERLVREASRREEKGRRIEIEELIDSHNTQGAEVKPEDRYRYQSSTASPRQVMEFYRPGNSI